MPNVTVDQFTNFARSTIAGGQSGLGTSLVFSDTQVYLQSGDGAKFPSSGRFTIMFGSFAGYNELAMCTSRTGDILTITRAIEGTSAQTWGINTTVALVVTAGDMQDLWTQVGAASYSLYNVRAYGAVGDGVTDDGPAVRTAIATMTSAGGGALYFPAGTYACGTGSNAENGSFRAIGFLPARCTMYGDGMDATKILLIANATNGAKMLMNWHIQSGGDEYITIRDLTFDGNSQNQSMPANGCRGVHIMRARNVHFARVRFKDMYGTNGGATESTATTLDFCDLGTYTDCEVSGSGLSPISDTGYALNFCNNINYVACVARSMGGGGFTESYCKNVYHEGCFAYLNGQYGFNAEQPQGTRYVNCQCGGSTSLRSSWGWNQGQLMGNASHGFVVLGGNDNLQNPQFAPTLSTSAGMGGLPAGTWSAAFTYQTALGETMVGTLGTIATTGNSSSITATIPALPPDSATNWNLYVSSVVNTSTLKKSNGVALTNLSYTFTAAGSGATVPTANSATYTITVEATWHNCISNYNGGSGLNLSTITGSYSRLTWVGGELIGNGSYGTSGGSGDQLTLVGHPIMANNSPANMRSGGHDHDAYGDLSAQAPAVPASGTELLNPFMIPVQVFINGGTLTAPFVQVGKSGAEVQVAAGTNALVTLGPGEYIKLTYSVAPTWNWVSIL